MQIIQGIKFLPKEGDIDSLFDRLSAYISVIDAGWVKNIKLATKETIELLLKASRIRQKGHSLPTSYRIFLKHMGEDDGGLLSAHLLVDSTVSEMYEYYEEENEFEPESINPEILVFGIFETGSQLSFDLRRSGEPSIIVSSDGEFVRLCSDSFEKLLFQNAFLRCEKLRFPGYFAYGGSKVMLKEALARHQVDNIFKVVDSYAIEHGFIKAWFSDGNHYIGYRNDAAFMVEQREGMISTVYGDNKEFALRFGNDLSIAIGAEQS
jgi:hypothetical protein